VLDLCECTRKSESQIIIGPPDMIDGAFFEWKLLRPAEVLAVDETSDSFCFENGPIGLVVERDSISSIVSFICLL